MVIHDADGDPSHSSPPSRPAFSPAATLRAAAAGGDDADGRPGADVRAFLSSLRSHVEERVGERLGGLGCPAEAAALLSAATAVFPFLAGGRLGSSRGLAGLRGAGGPSAGGAASAAAGRGIPAAAEEGAAKTAQETDERLDSGDGDDEGNYSDGDGIPPLPDISVDDDESDRKPAADVREGNKTEEHEPTKSDKERSQDSPKGATERKGKQSTGGKPKPDMRSAQTREDEEEYEPSDDDDEDDTLRPIKRQRLSGSAKSKSKSKSAGRGRGRPRLDGRPPIKGGEKPTKPSSPVPKFSDQRLRACRLYLERHGHLSVPSDYDDRAHRDLHNFGAWASAMRDDYRRFVGGEFPEEKPSRHARTRVQVARGLELLEELGFDFGTEDGAGRGDKDGPAAEASKKPAAASAGQDAVWNWRLEKCLAYKSENGHLNPPAKHPVIGGNWLAHLRELYDLRLEKGQSALTPVQNKRVRKLVEIGFCFDKVFDVNLQKLEAYKKSKGTCHIPIKYAPDPPLGKWAEKIRRENNKLNRGETSSYLTADRLRKLAKVGFVFDQQKGENLPWEERFQMLKAYREEHGKDPTGSHETLGRWVNIQRRAYSQKKEGANNPKHKLSDEREEKLLSVGFVFETKERIAYSQRVKAGYKAPPKVTWEGRLAEFVRWKERHGHPYVPTVTSGEDKGLGRWVAVQRMAYRAYKDDKAGVKYGKLTAEKALALSNAGFAFDASQIRRTPKSGIEAAVAAEEATEQDEPAANEGGPEVDVRDDGPGEHGQQEEWEESYYHGMV